MGDIVDSLKRFVELIGNVVSGILYGFTETEPINSPVAPFIDSNINHTPKNEKEARINKHQTITTQGVESSVTNINPSYVTAIYNANLSEVGNLTMADEALHTEVLPAKPLAGYKKPESMAEALKDMAKWYVNHVFTYQGNKQYEDFVVVDRVNGTSGHSVYNLGTGEDKRVEFLKDSTGTDIRFGGNYSYIGQKDGSDTEIKKKDGNVTNTYYFKRMTNDLNAFVYDCICYIKASIPACENNYRYVTRQGSILKYYIDCELVKQYKYNDVGDDCARFAFAVLEYATGIEANDLGNLGKDAGQFLTEDDTKIKMSDYFAIYTGNKLIEKFNEGLEDGDMLVGKIGDGENAQKKNTRNHCEFVYDCNNNRVFGWGNVKNKLESYSNFSIVGNYVYDGYSDFYYSALYRKKER